MRVGLRVWWPTRLRVVVVHNVVVMMMVVWGQCVMVWRRRRAMLHLLHHVALTAELEHVAFSLSFAFSFTLPLPITVAASVTIPVAIPLAVAFPLLPLPLPFPHNAIPLSILLFRAWALPPGSHRRHAHPNHPSLPNPPVHNASIANNASLTTGPLPRLHPSPSRPRRTLRAPASPRPKHPEPHFERLLLLRLPRVPVVPMERQRPRMMVMRRTAEVGRRETLLHLLLELLGRRCVLLGGRCTREGLIHWLPMLLLLLLRRRWHSHPQQACHALWLLLHAAAPAWDLLLLMLLRRWRGENVVSARRWRLVLVLHHEVEVA